MCIIVCHKCRDCLPHKLGVICKRLYDEGIIGGLGLGDDCIHVDARNLIEYANNKAIWFYERKGMPKSKQYKIYNEWFEGAKLDKFNPSI